jgi:hypothetical protein
MITISMAMAVKSLAMRPRDGAGEVSGRDDCQGAGPVK